MTDENIEKPEDKAEAQSAVKPRRSGLGIILLLLLALIACAGGFGLGYFQLSKINLSLAKKVSELETTVAQGQTALADLTQKMTAADSEQEKRFADWKQAQSGDTGKWKVAQAEYLTNMAQDNLQFSHDVKLALVLLQQANEIVTSLTDTRLSTLRDALSADITHLQAITPIDTTDIFTQLKTLNEQLDKLPLPKAALQADTAAAAMSPSEKLPWWKAGLHKSWELLGRIVIVRKTGDSDLPLALPDETQLLYQNLHAQMENATWGLLHQNKTVYQSSLSQVIAMVKKYFVQDADESKAMLQALEKLQAIDISPTDYSLTDTLKQFETYLALDSPLSQGTTVESKPAQ